MCTWEVKSYSQTECKYHGRLNEDGAEKRLTIASSHDKIYAFQSTFIVSNQNEDMSPGQTVAIFWLEPPWYHELHCENGELTSERWMRSLNFSAAS